MAGSPQVHMLRSHGLLSSDLHPLSEENYTAVQYMAFSPLADFLSLAASLESPTEVQRANHQCGVATPAGPVYCRRV